MQMLKRRSTPYVQRLVGCLAILITLFSVSLLANPNSACAMTDNNSAANQLEIKIGYTGGTYTGVRTFQLSDLEALPQVQQAYSFIDSMPSPVIDSAVGVKLIDILKACNIDVNNIKDFRLWTTDVTGAPYLTLTKTYLLDPPRYYFPHLADNWNAKTGTINFPNPSAAGADAVPVDTILAFHDNWQRELSGSLAPDFTLQDDSNRFRLIFGKTNDLAAASPEITATKAAKWVQEIDVTLNGTPDTGVPTPVYTITPVTDSAYANGVAANSITTMTVNSGVTGLKYFTVNISPVKAHSGDETIVFVHLRDGVELDINYTKADFDSVNTAAAGFNVQAGDIVKAYLVDELTNDTNHNPIIFQ